MLARREERPPASGPPTPDSSPEGGNRGRKITGHAGREPAKVDIAMLTPLDAEPLARKALLLQTAIAGLIASHKVEPQLACALDELAGKVTTGLLDVVGRVAR
jgi:hypothetical protein